MKEELIKQQDSGSNVEDYFAPKPKCKKCNKVLITQISKYVGKCTGCRGMFKSSNSISGREINLTGNPEEKR